MSARPVLTFHDDRDQRRVLAGVRDPFGGISFRPRPPFLDLPNVLGSPHNSGLVPGVVTESLLDAARNIAAYLGGRPRAASRTRPTISPGSGSAPLALDPAREIGPARLRVPAITPRLR